MPLGTQLFHHARQRPTALAVSLSGQQWSYRDLADQIGRIDHALRDLPAKRHHTDIQLPPHGRIMALAIGNHSAAAPLLATALDTSHAVMLMDAQWPEQQMITLLDAYPPDILFALSAQQSLVAHAKSQNIPTVLVDKSDALFDDIPPISPLPSSETDTFLIGFTSGTTSTPKAFARNRKSWRASLDASRTVFAVSSDSHTLAPGPLSHGVTLYAFAETLDAGAAFHGLARFSVPTCRRLLKSGDVRRLVAVPTMLDALSTSSPFRAVDAVTTAGAKLAPASLSKARDTFPCATICEYYGASELGFVSVSRHTQTASDAPSDSVGRPFAHVTLQLRENGQTVPQGKVGTIFVRGDLAIDKYLSGATSHGFRREGPWATVGDLGRILPDGSLALIGREGGMVLTGGYNVYPQEVADTLLRSEQISAAQVLGQEDALLGQRLVAILEGRIDYFALKAHCAQHLPNYKTPRAFYRVEAWPLTSRPKIARATLESWLDQKDPRLVPISPAS